MSSERQSSSPNAAKKMPAESDHRKICTQLWTKAIHGNPQRAGTKVGLEIEMFAYDSKTLAPLGIEGARLSSQDLMRRLENLVQRSKLKVDAKTQTIVGLDLEGGANFSLEPGGQVEFSSRPHDGLDGVAREVEDAFLLLEEAAKGEVVFLDHGTNPIAPESLPLLVPKHRYQILNRYFQSEPHGRGVHMMRNTATVQPNIDVAGEDNWNEAANLAFALTPFARHIFSNSNYFQGERSRFLSERQAIWESTDKSRTGIPLRVPFSNELSCEYAEWAREAFVFFVGELPVEEQPRFGELRFVDWLTHGYRGTRPTLQDWETHLGTLFPDLRLRGFLEVRSVDAQSFENIYASAAFWVAFLQHGETRKRALEFLNGVALGISRSSAVAQSESSNPLRDLLLLNANDAVFRDVRTHLKLVEMARESFEKLGDECSVASLLAFSRHLESRSSAAALPSALQFVKEQATLSPARDFRQNLRLGQTVARNR